MDLKSPLKFEFSTGPCKGQIEVTKIVSVKVLGLTPEKKNRLPMVKVNATLVGGATISEARITDASKKAMSDRAKLLDRADDKIGTPKTLGSKKISNSYDFEGETPTHIAGVISGGSWDGAHEIKGQEDGEYAGMSIAYVIGAVMHNLNSGSQLSPDDFRARVIEWQKTGYNVNPDFWSWVKSPTISKPMGVASSDEHPRNRIVYGAPGTGKSYRLKEDVKKPGFVDNVDVKRVTFHPDMTYGEFVGSYRPTPVYDESDTTIFKNQKGEKQAPTGVPHVSYTLEPGPFLTWLKKALDYPFKDDNPRNFVLIIEEINRANVSAVFGDVFQLLDRDEDGKSEYGLDMREEMKLFLKQKGEITIPSNLYLWATMNTTDAGVFPMDSAFKRRWSFEHISLDEGRDEVDSWVLPGKVCGQTGLGWNQLRDCINTQLKKTSGRFREDQLLGPFFLSESSGDFKNIKRVGNKLLNYLHQDLLRHDPSVLFESEYGSASYSGLLKAFEVGKNVFRFDFETASPSSVDIEIPEKLKNSTSNTHAYRIISEIISNESTSIESVKESRLRAIKSICVGQPDGYRTSVNQSICKTFIEDIEIEQFDSMVLEYLSGSNDDIIDKIKSKHDDDVSVEFEKIMKSARDSFPQWGSV